MKRLKHIIGAVALFTVAPTLYADIVWSGNQAFHLSYFLVGDDPPTEPPPEGEYLPFMGLDLNNDGIDDFQLGDDLNDVNPLWLYAEGFGNNKHTGNWIGEFGGVIDESTDWTGGEYLLVSWMLLLNDGQAGVGPWAGETGYMGVQFDSDDGTHFGWVHMTVYAEHPGMTIYGWAYESVPGEGIIAGAIPEPSSGLLTIIGAISVWFLRKKNRR